MAVSLPLHRELLVILMNSVWLSMLPLVLLSIRRSAGLELVRLISLLLVMFLNVLSTHVFVVVFIRHCDRWGGGESSWYHETRDLMCARRSSKYTRRNERLSGKDTNEMHQECQGCE